MNNLLQMKVISLRYCFLANQVSCTGGSREDMHGCCTKKNPCSIGEGDCKDNDDCEGDLICGQNNCDDKFTWDSADCCKKKKG